MAQSMMNESVRYEPDEHPPPLIAAGAGAQAAVLIVTPIVLTVVIVLRIAGQSDDLIHWAAFAALLVSGITTILQAVRVGRFGSGHVLIMGTSGAFIAICVAALTLAGAETMASLIVVSSLFQFLLAGRLSYLRRIFTPVVTGTVIMLIAATVFPTVFGVLTDVPEGTPDFAAPLSAGVTLLVVTGLVLRGPPRLRLWSPFIGIVAGTAVGAPFGIYDIQPILDAPWAGVSFAAWPGLDVTPGAEFWALLPAFIIVTLVGAIETIGDGVAIQRVSRRQPRATDFRVVQGSLNADGGGEPALRPGGHASQHHVLQQHIPGRGYGDRLPAGGDHHRGDIHPGGVLPQGSGADYSDTRAGGGGLHHRSAGAAVHPGHEDRHP